MHKISFSDRVVSVLTDLPIGHHWWVCHSGPSVKQQPQVIFLCLFSPSALLISCPNGQMSPTHGLNISTSNPGLSFFNPFLPFYSTCTAEDPTQSLRSSSHLLYSHLLYPDHFIRIHSLFTRLSISLMIPYTFNLYFIAN